MQLRDIPGLRLQSQQLTSQNSTSPAEVVQRMGAMQAQDLAMSKWAVGTRLPKATESEIEAAMDRGEILRTHLLRPTWHLVAAQDIHWMLALTAPRIKSLMKTYNNQLGLSPRVLSQSRKIIENTLTEVENATRDLLKTALENSKIDTGKNRLSHLLMDAEMEGLICSGKSKGKTQTYALLDQRVPEKRTFTRDEALAKLALRYFTSHGPATLKDFAWWSGLSVTDARTGLEEAKSALTMAKVNGESYFSDPSISSDAKKRSSLYLLPSFDEYFIAYRDRSTIIPVEEHSKAASSNGIFWPIIIQNGRVTGTWKRTVKSGKVIIEPSFFELPSATAEKRVMSQVKAFAKFLGKEPVLKY